MSGPVLPEVDIFVSGKEKQDDQFLYTGFARLKDKPSVFCNFKTDVDILKKQRKPKGCERMVAYVLAYHLALKNCDGASNDATATARKWLGVKTDGDIRRALREYQVPKKAICMMSKEPLSIAFLLEPQNLKRVGEKIEYEGNMWIWNPGADKAFVGYWKFDTPAANVAVTESPLVKLNAKKNREKTT